MTKKVNYVDSRRVVRFRKMNDEQRRALIARNPLYKSLLKTFPNSSRTPTSPIFTIWIEVNPHKINAHTISSGKSAFSIKL